MKATKKLGVLIALIGVATMAAPLIALAHHVISVDVDVDCDGYSVSAEANVFDNHRLVVRIDTSSPFDGVDGVNVYNQVEPGVNHDVTVGPFTGPETEGLVQVIIFAGPETLKVEDSQSASFANQENCETTEATTTTVAETTTTTEAPTSTVAEETTTTVGDPTTTTTTTQPEELPFTGLPVWPLSILGLALIGGGVRLAKE